MDPDDFAASDVTGLEATADAVVFDDFFLARHEVTNAEYKAFVDAGGYRRQEYWQDVIMDGGEEIPWDRAMERFVDRTGRPGPGTWEAGDYEDGQDHYPVTGVSWYEAAAYAQFARKELPSLYHWRRAFMSGAINGLPWITPASNLDSEGPAPVGQGQAMSWSGAFDMVGNAREWTFNAKGDERFVLGGGWNDPHYVGVDTNFVQPPLDRSSTNGFRLAITRDEAAVTARARAPLPDEDRDFIAEPPISDELFETYRRMFSYDRTPLNATVEGTETTRAWTRERISFDAAYGGERMILWHYDGGGLALLEEILAVDGDGVVMLPVLAQPGQSAGMFIGEVSRERFQSVSPAFRMRSFGWGQEVLRLAFPNMQFHVAVPGASGPDDILAAFAGGLLDGAEFVYPQADLALFVEGPSPNVIDLGVTHYYITAWQSPATLQYLAIHRPYFERLNARKQQQLRLAAQANTRDTHSRILQAQGQALKGLRDAGLMIGSLPEEVLTDLRAATETVLEQTAQSSTTFRGVLESLQRFVREQRTWQDRGHIPREFRFEAWGPDWAADVPVEVE